MRNKWNVRYQIFFRKFAILVDFLVCPWLVSLARDASFPRFFSVLNGFVCCFLNLNLCGCAGSYDGGPFGGLFVFG